MRPIAGMRCKQRKLALACADRGCGVGALHARGVAIAAQGAFEVFVVGERLSDKRPEAWGVIEFFQMAEFMHNNIVRHLLRQKQDAVAEVKVPLFRATAPTRFLIANGNTADLCAVMPVPVRDALVHEVPCRFLVLKIVPTDSRRRAPPPGIRSKKSTFSSHPRQCTTHASQHAVLLLSLTRCRRGGPCDKAV